jgi:hypothetical protein
MRIPKIIALLVALFIMAGSFFVVSPRVTRAECGVYHLILPGQNLFRISLRYGVSMHDIAAVNNIADIKVIYAGQRLYIPCVTAQGQVQVPLGQYGLYGTPYPTITATYLPGTGTPIPSNIIDAPIYDTVDCGGFRATSPLDGLVDGINIFYWDAPRSVDIIALYQVVVQDDRGVRVATFPAAGQTLRTSGDTSFNAIGGHSRFSWYVVALVNGNETCRTQVTTLPRQWNDSAGLSPNP